jgi:hypothetical protein
MGTTLENPDVQAVLDSGTDMALLRLHLESVIPRNRYLELATLMDQEHFADGACRSFPPQPRRS